MKRQAILMTVGLGVIALGILTAQEVANPKSINGEKIHREGTRLDQQAMTFSLENERLSVQVEGKKSIQVLENLAAQRVFRANRDDPEDNRWTITGNLTEFEGRNYLLIEHAVRIR